MTRLKIKSLLFTLALSIFLSGSSRAEEQTPEETAAARKLSINRSLLAKTEAEALSLEEEEEREPSESLEQKLQDVRYKIKALQEDAVRIQGGLPQNRQANEFLKDLIVQKHPRSKKISTDTATPKKEPTALEAKISGLHEKALELVSEKKLKEASRVYEDIILLDPEDDQAYLLMGHTYLLGGDYGKAETAFQNAVHIDPENMHEIVPFYKNIALQNPGDDDTYSNLGFAYLMVEDYSKAEEAFKDSLGINPENGEAQKGLKIASQHL